MKGVLVALGRYDGRLAAARVRAGQLDDLLIDPASSSAALLPGTILWARLDRDMPSLGGQFLRLSDDSTGFLRKGQLASGDRAPVQVSGFAEPGKAAPLTTKLAFRDRLAVVTPGAPGINVSRRIADATKRAELRDLAAARCPDGAGVILRSAAAEVTHEEVCAALDRLVRQSQEVSAGGDLPGPDAHARARADWGAPDAADFDELEVASLIDEMRVPGVALAYGASMVIEPTRALVAVDVNTGPDATQASGLKANLAALRDLPRQLRCRGLGGQIVVDAAPFPKARRQQVETALSRALQADPVETSVAGWTPLGHLELIRRRSRAPL